MGTSFLNKLHKALTAGKPSVAVDFCPSLHALLDAESVVGRTGKVFGRDILGSNSTKNNLTVLARLIMERKPKQTLEVGLSYRRILVTA